jgi:hypothetical protein
MVPHVRVALITVSLVAVISCSGSSSPSSPSTPSLTGTWVGAGFFPGTATAQLAQSGSTLTGTWVSTQTLPPELGGGPLSGAVNGTVNGSGVSLTFMVPPTTDCSFPVSVTATVNGNQMTGMFATMSSSCPSRLTGDISLTKQ